MEEWDPNYLGVRTIPEILRLARYFTFNEGKLHYNFVYDIDQLYDSHVRKMNFQGATAGAVWDGNAEKRPFFGPLLDVETKQHCHESNRREDEEETHR